VSEEGRAIPPEDIEVKLVALADAANVSIEGKLNLVGLFDIIWTSELPVRWPQMYFVAHLKVSSAVGQQHRFQLRCVDEDGHLHGPVIDLEMHLAGASKVPGVAPGLPLVLGIRDAIFPAHGTYTFELWRGDLRLCETELHVLPPSAGPGA